MSTNPPRRRDRRHERHDRTRAEILDEAWNLARREGVAAVSLRSLARAMDMQPQSLYTYFGSKNDVFDAMFAQGSENLLAAVRNVEADTPVDRLRRGAAIFVQYCTNRPETFLLVFQRVIPGFTPSPASMATAFALLNEFSSALRAAGVRDTAVIDLFTAAITGLISQQLSNDPGGDRWTKLLNRMIDALLRA